MEDPYADRAPLMSLGSIYIDEASSLKKFARSMKSPKGKFDRHVIRRYVRDGREYYLHATKGWRSRRI